MLRRGEFARTEVNETRRSAGEYKKEELDEAEEEEMPKPREGKEGCAARLE